MSRTATLVPVLACFPATSLVDQCWYVATEVWPGPLTLAQ
jgi:hypothetical protein